MCAKPKDGIIIEFVQLGDTVKVSAIDPNTMTEASIVGSPNASKNDLSKLAIRKLHYVMKKKAAP